MFDTARLATLSAALISFALAGSGGCFAESKTIVGGDGTSGGECAPGSLNCACYGNGTCDPGLSCAVEARLCIPENCTAGHLGCECADGACLSPLVCEAGICADGGSSVGESSTTIGMTSTDGTTLTSSPTTGSTTIPDDSTSTTAASEDSDVSDDESDSAGGCGAAADCGACLACVSQPGEVCGNAYAACQAEMACLPAAGCQADCALNGICPMNCCEGLTPGEATHADALSDCRGLACGSKCGRFDFPHCSG